MNTTTPSRPWILASVLGLGFLLMACHSPTPSRVADVDRPADPARCDATALQELLGTKLRDNTLEQARQRAGAESVRLLRPDSIITKEYRLGRLNVVADAQDRIVRVYCG